jgi:uncharacterized protein (DUF3820 family)
MLTDNDLMPFGMHKGTKLGNVPADYLLYLYHENKITPAVKDYVEANMNVLQTQVARIKKDKRGEGWNNYQNK